MSRAFRGTVLDFETTSVVDIKSAGAAPYVDHESTDILCLSYSINGGPVKTWLPGEPLPEMPEPFIAHNAPFDRGIWDKVMVPRYNAYAVSRWHCSAARSAMCGLPRNLQQASQALGYEGKDLSGSRTMLKYAKDPSLAIPPKDMSVIIEYCERDVEATVELWKRLPTLGSYEAPGGELDWVINERGIPIDVASCRVAQQQVMSMKEHANKEVARITEGAATTINQRAKLLAWLEGRGLKLENLRAETVRDTLNNPATTGEVRELLELRQSVGLSSLSKFAALLDRVDSNDRIRGSHLYFGAHTGRWSSRGAQFQNIPRGDSDNPDGLIDDMMGGRQLDGRELQSVIRSMVKANGEFAIADYGQIECRVLAWLAGEQDLLDQFGAGEDVYKIMSSTIYGCEPEDVTKDQRFIGKAAILGFGYGMGAPKFAATLAQQGVVIDEKFALTCRDAYRETNSRIKALWYDLHLTVVEAIKNPSTRFRCESLSVVVDGEWLKIRLPSGRTLFYNSPALEEPTGPHRPPGITYWTTSSITRQFEETRTYGGKLVENVVQGIARDVLFEAMQRLEKAGYGLVMHVHDEVVVEGHDVDLESIIRLMETRPTWGSTLPLVAEGFKSERFRK